MNPTVPPLNERGLIAWLRSRANSHRQVPLGIGDDAAVVALDQLQVLVAADMLMEGTHFTFPPATPELAGRKALAVNLSDVAAMAGRPVAAFVSVALPRTRGPAFARLLLEGIDALASQFGTAIAGGDTNLWDGPLVVDVSIIGEPTGRGPVPRHGARPGDWLFVTGELGGSGAARHLSFTPRVVEAQALHDFVDLHAMIDLSDGLASDVRHILSASGVGAVLSEDRLPISAAARRLDDGMPAVDHALGDGEDFELLFAVSPEDGRRLLTEPPIDTPLSHIGEISSKPDCELVDASGRRRPLPVVGWEHAY